MTLADWTAANNKARHAYDREPNLRWCCWADQHPEDPPCMSEATSTGMCRGHWTYQRRLENERDA